MDQQVTIGTLLSDLELLERLIADRDDGIFISPLIDPVSQVGPSSIDLRLGTQIIVMRTLQSTHVDLTLNEDEVRRQIEEYKEEVAVRPGGSFVLHPGAFALANTLEYIRLPRDIAGRLEGRSSLGRMGLQVHATAGFVDPGFEGTLTFELINSGKLPVKVFPGMRLGQLCCFRVSPVQVGYLEKSFSKYGRETSVGPSEIYMDPEMHVHGELERLVSETGPLGDVIRRGIEEFVCSGGSEKEYGLPTELAAITIVFPILFFIVREIGLPWLHEAKRYSELWRLKFHAWIDERYAEQGLDPESARAAGEALRRELEATTNVDAREAWERFAGLLEGGRPNAEGE